jgi:hypothetical protein
VGALIWLLYLVDSYGRRGVLIAGSIGGAISMYYIGAYIAIAKPAQHPTTELGSGGQSASMFFPLHPKLGLNLSPQLPSFTSGQYFTALAGM